MRNYLYLGMSDLTFTGSREPNVPTDLQRTHSLLHFIWDYFDYPRKLNFLIQQID